jgi:hypothetical protein
MARPAIPTWSASRGIEQASFALTAAFNPRRHLRRSAAFRIFGQFVERLIDEVAFRRIAVVEFGFAPGDPVREADQRRLGGMAHPERLRDQLQITPKLLR